MQKTAFPSSESLMRGIFLCYVAHHFRLGPFRWFVRPDKFPYLARGTVGSLKGKFIPAEKSETPAATFRKRSEEYREMFL